MTDVFISYARSDESLVQRFAECLEKRDLSVWWDRKLIPGDQFDAEIERMIREANRVVVVWSKNSVGSRWVRAEADEAFEQKKLIPIQIDDCRLPMEFRRIQTAPLIQWSGDTSHKSFLQVLGALLDARGRQPAKPSSTGGDPGWQVVATKFGWGSATATLKRGPFTRTVEYRNNVSNESVSVDGIEVCSAGTVTKRHPLFQFFLSDGPHTSVCQLEPVYGAIGRLVTARLSGIKLSIDGSTPSVLSR